MFNKDYEFRSGNKKNSKRDQFKEDLKNFGSIFSEESITESIPDTNKIISFTKEHIPETVFIEKPWEETIIVRYHPFKNLLRKHTIAESEGLKESIKEFGVMSPLIGWMKNDKIVLIDGYNRDAICQELKIPYSVHLEYFDTEIDVKIFIIKNQLERRNLNDYQRADYVTELKTLFREKAKQNQGTRTDLNNKNIDIIHTSKELGKLAGVSHDTINRVENIKSKSIPEIINKVKESDLSISAAYEISKLSHEDQREVAKLPNSEIKEKAKELRDFKKLAGNDREIDLDISGFTFDDLKIETNPVKVNVVKDTEFFKNYKNKVVNMINKVNDIEILIEIEGILLK